MDNSKQRQLARKARMALRDMTRKVAVHSSPPEVEIPSSLQVDKIPPQLTDSAIDEWLEPHYVFLSQSKLRRDKLFLFLSGSYGDPSKQCLILQEAAELGYHAINLCYPNSWMVGGLCRRSLDANCHEKVRLEILDGIKRSPEIEISRANCIENRLVKLLHYLDQKQPQEGWLNYLDGNSPQWESMVVAGHSQGGGHAAIIAKEHTVGRVILLGSPADYSIMVDAPASWLSKPHATPADRYYGFVHVKDQGVERIFKAWELLGMAAYGSVVNVDQTPPPYNQSHQLITAARPARPEKYHGSVVVDLHTPKLRDGTPAFKQVWRYLLAPVN